MSAPKSVIKVKKAANGTQVEYTSNVDAANYYIFELSRAALRDVGKYVKKVWQNAYDSHFKKHKGYGRQATTVKVYSNKNTKYPRLEIGLPKSKKGKEVQGFYSYFQEFGTSTTPKMGLLTHAVEDNIAEIVKIESQYLTTLSDEAERLNALIDEGEYNDE